MDGQLPTAPWDSLVAERELLSQQLVQVVLDGQVGAGVGVVVPHADTLAILLGWQLYCFFISYIAISPDSVTNVKGKTITLNFCLL